uniref:protein-serine/threonine phosphatase n=1 Tax=Morus alba TaxID=3498 RepID=A0A6G8IRM6_MORAL|nr:abscisic acid insensitive 1 protein [Morus alba]
MEKVSSTVAVPFRLGNLIHDDSAVTTQLEINGLKLIANTATLFSNPHSKSNLPCESISCGTEGFCHKSPHGENRGADELTSRGDQFVNNSCSLYLSRDNSSTICGEKFYGSVSDSVMKSHTTVDVGMDVDKFDITGKATLRESSIDLEYGQDIVAVEAGFGGKDSDGSGPYTSTSLVGVSEKKTPNRTRSGPNVFGLDCLPLWGFTCICGRRPEMEDAVAVVPRLLQVPVEMLEDHHYGLNGVNRCLNQSRNAHFFGVYDGHGGNQVANYCKERLHSALVEEIETAKAGLHNRSNGKSWQEMWKKAFSNCLTKVDAEVGGAPIGNHGSNCDESSDIPRSVAPETVGSTAVVAVICPTQIIVANCGDSRAVLFRGKTPVPLSVDHKPDREDEYERIEAAGGKVMQWNGSRVFGVLAMSRSIGDRYLKPWIIPDPEVMIVSRAKEDECLILASDGLWDVMTNEEACEIARRRILLWHKKYGDTLSAERGKGVDLAAQDAAEYLSRVALQKGSKDNITVIVVDLKAARKFKRKAQE